MNNQFVNGINTERMDEERQLPVVGDKILREIVWCADLEVLIRGQIPWNYCASALSPLDADRG